MTRPAPTRRPRRPAAALRALRALARGDEGAAAVEFAIVAPILVMVLFGIADFGRALWTYNVAVSALREGGRSAAVAGTTCPGTDVTSAAQTRTTAYLQSVLGANAVLPTVTVACSAAGIITVGYANDSFAFTPIAPLVSQFTSTSLAVRPAAFRWERAP